MKKFLKNSCLYIRKLGSVGFILATIVLSVLFFMTSTYGIQNSSICALEKQAHFFKADNGSDIRIRLYLSEESEGKRKSIINHLNSFNDYRITEFGRCGSYVLNKQFNITFNDGVSVSNQILYSDYYSEYYTNNRINLTSTKFDKDTFYDKHSIYITPSIVSQVPGLTVGNVVGQKVRLSLDGDEEEYVVRGVIENKSVKNNGKVFSDLFSESFIVTCSPLIYKFDFTDLLFQSPDYYFVDDFTSFQSAFSKSYMTFSDIELRTASVVDSTISLSAIFKMSNPKNAGNVTISVFSIIGIVILSTLQLALILICDLNNLPILEKVITCIISLLWAFIPMASGLFLMVSGSFLSRIVISLLIGFAAGTLITIITKYSFFNHKEEENEDNHAK